MAFLNKKIVWRIWNIQLSENNQRYLGEFDSLTFIKKMLLMWNKEKGFFLILRKFFGLLGKHGQNNWDSDIYKIESYRIE